MLSIEVFNLVHTSVYVRIPYTRTSNSCLLNIISVYFRSKKNLTHYDVLCRLHISNWFLNIETFIVGGIFDTYTEIQLYLALDYIVYELTVSVSSLIEPHSLYDV